MAAAQSTKKKQSSGSESQSKPPKKLIAVGGRGQNGGLHATIDEFDFSSKRWRLADFKLPDNERSHAAVGTFEQRLYVFGGSPVKDRLDVYDGEKSTWLSPAEMLLPRSFHSICSFNNRLVLLGGVTKDGQTTNVDAFDPATNQWESLACMSTKRSSLAAVVLRGEIYAIGGKGGEDGKAMSSVEKFDGIRWSPVASLKQRRSGHCAAVVGDQIFVFGGVNERNDILSSVEKFDLTSDSEWKIDVVPEMLVPRWGAGAIAYEGRVYVFGGETIRYAYLDTIDVFDPTTNKWKEMIESRMTTPRCFFGVALI